jgi:acetate kinase
MGLTPLEGLPGGTRSGTLDPSLTYHLFEDPMKSGELMETNDIKISRGELILNKQSGFKGLCGTNEFGKITEKAKEQEKNGQLDGKELLCVKIFENRILVSPVFISSHLIEVPSSLSGFLPFGHPHPRRFPA